MVDAVQGKRAELLALFDRELAAIREDENWYRRTKVRWRNASYACKGVAALAFLAGSLAPFAQLLLRWAESLDLLAWGYMLLVLAGLLIAIDQLFLASRNWTRFANAELSLRLVRQLLALERERFAATTPDDAAAADKFELFHGRIVEARKEVGAIIRQETESWSSELDQAARNFEQAVKNAIDHARQSEGERKNATATAEALGAIRVIIRNPERIPGRLVITAGEEVRELAAAPPMLAFGHQSPGLHRVRLEWLVGDDQWCVIEDILMVEPAEIAEVAFELPAGT